MNLQLKLLQINSVVNSGSTGRIVEEIGQMAKVNGWQSYIAYGRYDRSSQSELIKIGNDWDIKLHGVQTRLFDKHGFGSNSATKKLVKQIEEIKPDIIHLHNLHGYYLNIEILFNYLKTIETPIIWTLHDCWPMTGHCSHFDFIGCQKWKTECFNCPQMNEYPASFLIDRSKINYKQKKKLFTSLNNLTIVPVSNWLAGITKQSFLDNYPVKVINNGVNIETFKPFNDKSIKKKYNLKDKFKLVGVASVWSSRKGLKDFIELSERLDNKYQIILVGLNDNQLKDLPDNIIGLKRTENLDELVALYSIADIVLNLSYEETFGLTTLEGFACGTPSIVYNSTASPELITSETGIIIEKGNISDLINGIETIRLNGKDSYKLACRKRAESVYNKDNRYMDYLNLYESKLTK